MATTTSPGLGSRTLRGMAWAYGSYVGLRLTTVVPADPVSGVHVFEARPT